jgi:hypothetical protein
VIALLKQIIQIHQYIHILDTGLHVGNILTALQELIVIVVLVVLVLLQRVVQAVNV